MTTKSRTRNPWGSKGVLCPHCKRKNPPEGFYNNGYCKPCGAKYYRERRKDPIIAAKVREQMLAYCRRHPDRIKARGIAYNRRLKRAVIGHYGNSCACCGESDIGFLSIDHINNNGSAHRRELRATGYGAGGYGLYRWLKNHAYPPGYRVLCYNCNMARGFYGLCPHELAKAQRDSK